ncbi:superoxide dismutase [Calycina marina]|uniref:Superoxide dismutase n=1 Tax=Calycina marina TaxID=1763456 RepID=A0A9P7Z395_9HELO|nr:superoxide dismutase [Calycina marina]
MPRPRFARLGLSLGSIKPSIRPVRTPCRSLFTVPPIENLEKMVNGIPEFLSPAAVDMAWTQYQGYMIERLNNLVAGGQWQNADVKQIAINYARDPNSAPIFNYASMAHNNHFFFEALQSHKVPIPQSLKTDLEKDFSSIETLQREMIVTASSMFGPGFVWLVHGSVGNTGKRGFRILTTYLAGSPYSGAHTRRQATDMNTESNAMGSSVARGPPANAVGAHGNHSKAPGPTVAPGGIDVQPVLCLNTWEHVYLPDYGVAGKMAYASCWWERVNWSLVARRLGKTEFNQPSKFQI